MRAAILYTQLLMMVSPMRGFMQRYKHRLKAHTHPHAYLNPHTQTHTHTHTDFNPHTHIYTHTHTRGLNTRVDAYKDEAVVKHRISTAVVVDIDGVVIKGNQVVPSAPAAMKALKEMNIPHMFISNGGGITEGEKAAALSEMLGTRIEEHQVQLSHTPIRHLISKYQNDRVLIVGSSECHRVAKHYGFRNTATIDDIHKENPRILPTRPVHNTSEMKRNPQLLVIMHDPEDWHRDIQICMDVLRGGYPIGSGTTQAVHIITTNHDLLYSSDYPVPRLAQGSFTRALMGLYKDVYGEDLKLTFLGKPHKETYEYAHNVLSEEYRHTYRVQKDVPIIFENIFMIGDNPKSDIKGANEAGDVWKSVLVKTGVFEGENDAENPADYVFDDIGAAVRDILENACVGIPTKE